MTGDDLRAKAIAVARQSGKDKAAEIVRHVNEHVRIYGCRYQDGRWRHFCGLKTPRKEPDERPAETAAAAPEKT